MARKPMVCNVCGGPQEVTYTEEDHTTGMRIQKKHIVECLGHSHLHPMYWNGSDTEHTIEDKSFLKVVTFSDYKKYFFRLRKQNEQTSK